MISTPQNTLSDVIVQTLESNRALYNLANQYRIRAKLNKIYLQGIMEQFAERTGFGKYKGFFVSLENEKVPEATIKAIDDWLNNQNNYAENKD